MKKTLFCIVVSIFLIGGTAQAAIVSVFDPGTSSAGTPATKLLVAPSNMDPSTAAGGASNTGQEGFDEMQDVLLGSALSVDGGGSIAAGNTVDSHMLFMNLVDSDTSLLTHYDVVWTFDGPIMGVMSDRGGTLEAASSALLGAAGTTYPGASSNRGLENNLPPQQGATKIDGYTINGNKLTWNTNVTQPGDWIRVITNANPIPAPGAVILTGIGMGIVGWFRRKTFVG